MSIPHSFTPPLKGSPTPPIHSFTPPLPQTRDHFYTAEDLEFIPRDISDQGSWLRFQLVQLRMYCEGSEEDLRIQRWILDRLDPQACGDESFLPIFTHMQELAAQRTWTPEINRLSGRAIRKMTQPTFSTQKHKGNF